MLHQQYQRSYPTSIHTTQFFAASYTAAHNPSIQQFEQPFSQFLYCWLLASQQSNVALSQ
jgi:hypothetical protein